MKVGVNLPQYEGDFASGSLDLDAVAAYARAAERWGIDGVWVSDHPFAVAPDGTTWHALDPFTVLDAVAAATDRIGLGTLVLACSRREPADVAAFAHLLGPARTTLGLGCGWYREEHEALGVSLPPFAERVSRLERCVGAARAAGARVLVGGTARAVRDVAARAADAWNMAWDPSPERFRATAAGMGGVARSVGLTVLVADGRADAVRAVERLRARAPFIGSTDALLGAICWGTPDAIAERIAAYGADEVVATLPLRDDLEMLERFATEAAPALRAP